MKTVTELAKDLKISRQRLHVWLQTHGIETRRIGNMIVIDSDTERIIREKRA